MVLGHLVHADFQGGALSCQSPRPGLPLLTSVPIRRASGDPSLYGLFPCCLTPTGSVGEVKLSFYLSRLLGIRQIHSRKVSLITRVWEPYKNMRPKSK